MEQNRLDILKKVENGELSLEKASEILADLEHNEIVPTIVDVEPENFNQSGYESNKTEKFEKPTWSHIFWIIPLLLGVILTIFSSTWLYQNYQSSGLGFKFWLTWIPFLIGVFMIYFGWILQKSIWIHINIKQPKGQTPQRIFIALPLPIQLLGFFLRIFKNKIPSNISNINIDEIIQNIGQQIKKDEPFYINVDDEDGTKVEIYIG
jgi:hypothetical protein